VSHVLIAGNGPAAHRLVERLRHHGHAGAITVLGAERAPAYNRVLLGSVLDGTVPPHAVMLPDLQARVRLGAVVTGVNRSRRLVRTNNGVVHRYDELVLATGSRPVLPDVPGLRSGGRLAAGVTRLRTLDDCTTFSPGSGKVVILGGGVLGVETACGLAGRGVDVTLVHRHAQLMNRHLDGTGGRLLADHLRGLGIALRLGRAAAAYRPGELVLDDGETLPSAAVVLCAGVTPEATLARAAGLLVRRGVVVDDRLRTSDRYIHAIGDCAEHDGNVSERIEPAWEQADTLARRLTGADAQYRGGSTVTRLRARGVDLAIVGTAEALAGPDTETELVTLSDPARGRYATLALRDQRVHAAVLVGFPQAIASVTQLHHRGERVPSDRLGLLLGMAASVRRAMPGELPDTAVICHCNNVTKQMLTNAWHDGARDIAGLARITRATTGCGTCTGDIRRLCGALHAAPAGPPIPTEQEGAA
jgi:assimilatory nitrate reductase electron transfer subunit